MHSDKVKHGHKIILIYHKEKFHNSYENLLNARSARAMTHIYKTTPRQKRASLRPKLDLYKLISDHFTSETPIEYNCRINRRIASGLNWITSTRDIPRGRTRSRGRNSLRTNDRQKVSPYYITTTIILCENAKPGISGCRRLTATAEKCFEFNKAEAFRRRN